MNEMLVAEMSKRMEQNMSFMDPSTMMSAWKSVGTQAQDAFVKLMTTSSQTAMKAFTDKP